MRKLTTIISPSQQGGVLDYSYLIAERLSAAVVNSIDRTIENDHRVIVQYSGYGFAENGAPWDLVKDLYFLRRKGVEVYVFFHEIFAAAPLWRRTFWQSIQQRLVAKKIVEECSGWLTNCQWQNEWLNARGKTRNAMYAPVFSNIGEPKINSEDLNQRRSQAVIFGGSSSRHRLYKKHGEKLFDWSRCAGIELIDIGPVSDGILAFSENISIKGELPPRMVSEALLQSAIGITAYPLKDIEKSGVVAAFASHGLAIVSLNNEEDFKSFGFISKIEDLSIDRVTVGADRALTWYQERTLASHIEKYHAMLAGHSQ